MYKYVEHSMNFIYKCTITLRGYNEAKIKKWKQNKGAKTNLYKFELER